MEIIRGVIVNADEYKTDEIISPNKIETKWVAVDDMLDELRKIDANYADEKAQAIRSLMNRLDTQSNENKKEGK